MKLGFLAALALFAGCVHVRPCGTAIGWVQPICVDPAVAECWLPFVEIPPQGCGMTLDLGGPAERPVTCVRSCERAAWAR